MSSPFSVFRKHQKILLVVLVGLSMLSFVIFDVVQNVSDMSQMPPTLIVLTLAALVGSVAWVMGITNEKSSEYGSIGLLAGVAIGLLFVFQSRKSDAVSTADFSMSRGELNELVNQRFIANRFVVEAIQRTQADASDMQRSFLMQQYQFGFGFPEEQVDRDVLIGELLRREAEKIDMSLPESAVHDYIRRITDGKMTREAFREIRHEVRASESDIVAALRNELLARMAASVLYARVDLPPAVNWEFSQRLQVREKATAAGVPVSAFIDEQAEPPQAELDQLFAQYRENPPGMTADGKVDEGRPGFLQPTRVKLAYVTPDYQFFEQQAAPEVTDAEIEERYQRDYVEPAQTPAADSLIPGGPSLPPGGNDPNAPAGPSLTPPGGTPPATGEAAPASPTPPAGAPAPEPGAPAPSAESPDNRPPSPGVEIPASQPPAEEPAAPEPPPRAEPPAEQGCDDAPAADEAPAPAEPPAEAKPEASTPADPAAKPTDGASSPATAPQSAADAPAAAPGPDDPFPIIPGSTETPPPTPKTPIPPLDDALKLEIREQLIAEKTTAAIERAMSDAVEVIRNQIGRDFHSPEDSPQKITAEQATEKVKAYANEHHFTYVESELLSYDELMKSDDYPVAQFKRHDSGNPFQSFSVADELFNSSDADILRPRQVEDRDAAGKVRDRAIYWKLDHKPAYVPEDMSEERVRESVVKTWRELQARKLAEARAQELAAQVRKSEKSMLETLSDATITGQENSTLLSIVQTGQFAWMRQTIVPARTLQGFDFAPVRSQIPGLEPVGDDFMRTVFHELKPGDVGVAPSLDRSVYYVVKIDSRIPGDEEEWATVRNNFLSEEYDPMVARLGAEMMSHEIPDWRNELFQEYDVQFSATAESP